MDKCRDDLAWSLAEDLYPPITKISNHPFETQASSDSGDTHSESYPLNLPIHKYSSLDQEMTPMKRITANMEIESSNCLEEEPEEQKSLHRSSLARSIRRQ
jgi:hypothetical protein